MSTNLSSTIETRVRQLGIPINKAVVDAILWPLQVWILPKAILQLLAWHSSFSFRDHLLVTRALTYAPRSGTGLRRSWLPQLSQAPFPANQSNFLVGATLLQSPVRLPKGSLFPLFNISLFYRLLASFCTQVDFVHCSAFKSYHKPGIFRRV